MMEYYSSDSLMLTEKMRSFGFDPSNNSLDTKTPEGIGNLAAKTVIEARMNDGSNQDGRMSGSNGKPYSDYTGYHPVNPPDTMNDIKRWQPKYFSDGNVSQFFLRHFFAKIFAEPRQILVQCSPEQSHVREMQNQIQAGFRPFGLFPPARRCSGRPPPWPRA